MVRDIIIDLGLVAMGFCFGWVTGLLQQDKQNFSVSEKPTSSEPDNN